MVLFNRFVRQILRMLPLSYSLTDNKVGGVNSLKPMVKEFHDFLEKQGHRSWDDIEKEMQDELWRIGNKYNVSGPTVFHEYMDWRASQLKK